MEIDAFGEDGVYFHLQIPLCICHTRFQNAHGTGRLLHPNSVSILGRTCMLGDVASVVVLVACGDGGDYVGAKPLGGSRFASGLIGCQWVFGMAATEGGPRFVA